METITLRSRTSTSFTSVLKSDFVGVDPWNPRMYLTGVATNSTRSPYLSSFISVVYGSHTWSDSSSPLSLRRTRNSAFFRAFRQYYGMSPGDLSARGKGNGRKSAGTESEE